MTLENAEKQILLQKEQIYIFCVTIGSLTSPMVFLSPVSVLISREEAVMVR